MKLTTYIRLVRMTDEGRKFVKETQTLADEAAKILEENGARRVHSWATLGRYDFIVVVEAPDDAAMLKISAHVGALGWVDVETLPAVPSDEFIGGL